MCQNWCPPQRPANCVQQAIDVGIFSLEARKSVPQCFQEMQNIYSWAGLELPLHSAKQDGGGQIGAANAMRKH